MRLHFVARKRKQCICWEPVASFLTRNTITQELCDGFSAANDGWCVCVSWSNVGCDDYQFAACVPDSDRFESAWLQEIFALVVANFPPSPHKPYANYILAAQCVDYVASSINHVAL